MDRSEPAEPGTPPLAGGRASLQWLAGELRRLRAERGHWLVGLACIPAVILCYRLLAVLSGRLRFPLDLEWCEGGELLHAHRVLHGLDVYAAPNQGYMPYSYPPGHALLLALVGLVFGVDYVPGRVVSWITTLLLFVLLAREVYREFEPVGVPAFWAILAAGFMAAAFPLTGGWFDLIRNDTLVLACAVGAAVLVQDEREMSRRKFVATAALMTFGIFTKQTCVFYVAWILLFDLFRRPRRALAMGVTVALFAGAAVALLQWITHQRYLYYVLFLLAKQQVFKERYTQALQAFTTFAPYLPYLPAVLAVLAWFRLTTARGVLWCGMLAAAMPASLLPYAKQGGYVNNLLPVALLAGPVALCLGGTLLRGLPRGSTPSKAMAVLLAIACASYLDGKKFAVATFAVSEERWKAAERLQETVRRLGKSVLSLQHPMLAIRAGSSLEQLHEMPWADAWLAGVGGLNFAPFLRRTHAEYVVFTGMEIPLVYDALTSLYTLDRVLPRNQEAPPVTGFPSWPRYILRHRGTAKNRRCVFDFERSGYDGWTRSGNAFDSGPIGKWITPRTTAIGMQGNAMASSRSRTGADVATGTLDSPEFELTSRSVTLLVGGSASPSVSVNLVTGGAVVATARGQGPDLLARVVWKTGARRGQRASIRIVDGDGRENQHILVDGICQED